jgi:N-acylneuraminate cytidylyltransferase/CMP-N,N'-diacetyllegionaminic acid synthase
MYKNKKILAIVPARGGSKGLPGKNIKLLSNKPLIGWSIEQAKESKYIDEIFISTDSEEIAIVGETFGIKTPSLRPAYLASDTASSMDFILYTIDKLEQEEKCFDYLILLEPTSPLRDVYDIDRSLEMLIENPDAESIVGVCKVEAVHPYYLTGLDNGFLVPYIERTNSVRRQDLDDLYFFEGSIYASSIQGMKSYKRFYHEKCLAYIVPKWKSYEVDDFIDFTIIESIMKLKTDGFFNNY